MMSHIHLLSESDLFFLKKLVKCANIRIYTNNLYFYHYQYFYFECHKLYITTDDLWISLEHEDYYSENGNWIHKLLVFENKYPDFYNQKENCMIGNHASIRFPTKSSIKKISIYTYQDENTGDYLEWDMGLLFKFEDGFEFLIEVRDIPAQQLYISYDSIHIEYVKKNYKMRIELE